MGCVWRAQISWDNMIYPTTVLLAQLTDNPAFHASAQAFLQKWLCSSGDTISYTPLGRAYNRFDPSLGQTMHAALVSVIYGQAIQPPPDAPKPFQARELPPIYCLASSFLCKTVSSWLFPCCAACMHVQLGVRA